MAKLQYQTSGQSPELPILSYEEVARICSGWRQMGETIAFTNGCFDVIHEGHLELLTSARRQGDRLVIGLNTDEWVRRHKGLGRPLQSAKIRRAVVHCMANADLSFVFDEETAERLLAAVKPDVYVLGGDYSGKRILGSQHCGEVIIISRIPGLSTTALIAGAGNAITVREHVESQLRPD